jgi:hypothetical protein
VALVRDVLPYSEHALVRDVLPSTEHALARDVLPSRLHSASGAWPAASATPTACGRCQAFPVHYLAGIVTETNICVENMLALIVFFIV